MVGSYMEDTLVKGAKIRRSYFKCYSCNRLFDEPKIVYESRGEFWGMPCSEEMQYCPHCNSDEIDYIEEYED